MCLISIILQIVQENNALFIDFIVREEEFEDNEQSFAYERKLQLIST